jgi:uncharacterized membrane protein
MESRRAESFSDGVFAGAITVLVFNLLPVGSHLHKHTLTYWLLNAWPQYAAYAVSFLTIGIMWMNHHTLLAQVQRVSRMLLVLNTLLLLGVVAVPFPTALVAQYLVGSPSRPAGTAKFATVFYGLVMIVISIGFSAMWLYVSSHREQLVARTELQAPRVFTLRFSAGLGGYLIGTALAAFEPYAALAVFGLIAVYYLFEHLPEPEPPDAGGAVTGTQAGADPGRLTG